MSFFDFKDNENGGVFIKKVPPELNKYIKPIRDLYLKESNSEELNNTLNHIWYSKSSPELKSLIEKFQNHKFFHNLCDNSKKCRIENIKDMDEIMYSNSKIVHDGKHTNKNYYGASSQYGVHRDCEICSLIFKKTYLYRVLIGLTDENKYVMTYFTKYNTGKNLNSGDVIGFDFDKTFHKVINIDNKQVKPRILLKLHFLVCENCNISDKEFQMIKRFYIFYDRFLRSYTSTGTDPKYPHEFIIGLTCYFMYYPYTKKILLLYFISAFIYIKQTNNYQITPKNTSIILLKSFIYLIIIFLIISLLYWLRFVIFNIK